MTAMVQGVVFQLEVPPPVGRLQHDAQEPAPGRAFVHLFRHLGDGPFQVLPPRPSAQHEAAGGLEPHDGLPGHGHEAGGKEKDPTSGSRSNVLEGNGRPFAGCRGAAGLLPQLGDTGQQAVGVGAFRFWGCGAPRERAPGEGVPSGHLLRARGSGLRGTESGRSQEGWESSGRSGARGRPEARPYPPPAEGRHGLGRHDAFPVVDHHHDRAPPAAAPDRQQNPPGQQTVIEGDEPVAGRVGLALAGRGLSVGPGNTDTRSGKAGQGKARGFAHRFDGGPLPVGYEGFRGRRPFHTPEGLHESAGGGCIVFFQLQQRLGHPGASVGAVKGAAQIVLHAVTAAAGPPCGARRWKGSHPWSHRPPPRQSAGPRIRRCGAGRPQAPVCFDRAGPDSCSGPGSGRHPVPASPRFSLPRFLPLPGGLGTGSSRVRGRLTGYRPGPGGMPSARRGTGGPLREYTGKVTVRRAG